MKISKSKRQLAQLLIEAGVKQFPEGANWAAQDKVNEGGYDRFVGFYDGDDTPKCTMMSTRMWRCYSTKCKYMVGRSVQLPTLIPNWHQTVLSRAEFDQVVAESAEQSKPDADGWIEWGGVECPVSRDAVVDVRFSNGSKSLCDRAGDRGWDSNQAMHITAYRLHKPEQAEPQYCESVTRNIPELAPTPTLDALLRDYRDASDFAAAKQAEADEAAKMRDERWKSAQARACELGVHIIAELVVDAEMHESEPVITDWRDLRKGDVIWWSGDSNFSAGEYAVYDTEGCGYEGPYTILLEIGNCREWIDNDGEEWRFIRRP